MISDKKEIKKEEEVCSSRAGVAAALLALLFNFIALIYFASIMFAFLYFPRRGRALHPR